VWERATHRYLFVEVSPQRAGQARHLVFVEDIERFEFGGNPAPS